MKLKNEHIDWWRFDSIFYCYLDKIDSIFREFCLDEFSTRLEPIMTSGKDGSHMTGSLHYAGRACDIRLLTHPYYTTELIPNAAWVYNESLAEELQKKLGGDFDVVLERTHIHIELDPKT